MRQSQLSSLCVVTACTKKKQMQCKSSHSLLFSLCEFPNLILISGAKYQIKRSMYILNDLRPRVNL